MSIVEDMREHYELYFLGMNPQFKSLAPQQDRMIPLLEQIEAGKLTRLMVWLPPQHTKTKTCTEYFVPWYFGRNPSRNVMLISYSTNLASDTFGSSIKLNMDSTVHKKCFPSATLSKDTRSKKIFRTKKGGAFYAGGFDSGIYGKTANLIIIDDPLKNKQEAESETTENFLIETYDTIIKSRFAPGGALIMVLTRLAIRDFAARVLEKEGTVETGGIWKVLKIPAEDENGNFLWESYHGRTHYLENKFLQNGAVRDTWYSAWQQEPGQSSIYKFREEWLCYYDTPIYPGKFNAYMFVDPATSKGKLSDFTCMWVICAGSEERLFVVDGVYDRLDPGERATQFLALCRKWNPRRILYEEYGAQADSFYLKREMRQQGFRVFPTPVGRSGPRHNLSKGQRIEQIVPFFKGGHIWLPRKLERVMHDGQRVDIVKKFVDDEYKLWKGQGSLVHDDMLDCMARIMDMEEHGKFQYAAGGEAPDIAGHEYAPGTTWQSAV